jgi:hypothetical protein
MREAFAGILRGCHVALVALKSYWSQHQDDNRFFAVVVSVLGIVPCLLMILVLFAK